MGLFGLIGSESSSSTTNVDKRTAASEGSLAVGQGGSFQEGGISAGDANKIGTTEVGSGSTITITDVSADVLNNALDKYAELSSGFGSSLNQFVSQANEDQDKKVATLLGAVDKAKASEDAGAQNRKIFVGLAIAFLVLIGWFAWRKS